ncbi:MAG TPA: phosphatidylinositol mannoside acyltransferase [Acidimicrobiales bacterium]|nr:phosphatidylinositol mannoside acyltransferase [Acidimicrobiales bacterium]
MAAPLSPSFRRRLALHAYRSGSAIACALPDGVASAAERPLGALLALAMGARREMVERHLRRVHAAALSPAALRTASRRSFESYARYWIESFRLPAMGGDEIDAGMWAEGLPYLDAALAAGNGAILALPHLGGWDFAGAWLVRRGYPLAVVVESVEPPELLAWFTTLRTGVGLNVIPLGPAAGSAVLRELRANRVVALLCDRDIGGGGIEVEFFGERTTLPGGPMTLALRAGAAVLPTAVYFEGNAGHRGEIRPSVVTERRGSRRADVARLTQDLAAGLESLIRAAPEQWHLFQPNWPSDHRQSSASRRHRRLSSKRRTPVTASDNRSEPTQPRRLEKKRNIS